MRALPTFLFLFSVISHFGPIPCPAADRSVADTTRPWIRWWWPGSAVSEQGLTHQLEAVARAGFGGVEVTPIYGAKGWEDDYVAFLSPRWVELLEHAGREAKRLGLGLDMTTGTGWPFGGPEVDAAMAAEQLRWEQGDWVVAKTGQEVKRAAPGGEGLVIDPYSESAILRYLQRFDAALHSFPDQLLRSQFHDSFEYYGANWTEGFQEAFREMHGYPIGGYIEELLSEKANGESSERLARLKHDYRATLDRLHQDYLLAWKTWANDRGWLVRNQSHGAPANLLDLYAIADIPETEIFGSTPFPIEGLRRDPDAIRHGLDLPEPLVTRMASSAAHVMGKRLVSSETATWLRDHWKTTLGYVKPEIDRIFLDGINHVFYHGLVYSPQEARWPGWLFYASTQFNPANPWWDDLSALNGYVRRTQEILQSGVHGNDVLLYWPASEIWQDAAGGLAKQLTVHDVGFVVDHQYGEVAKTLQESGYAFDYLSDRQIEMLSVEGRDIVSPGGRYATLVVPPVTVMPLATLRAVLELAEQGATIVLTELPKDVPGWGSLEQRRERFRSLIGPMENAFSEGTTAESRRISIGEGQVIIGEVLQTLPRTTAIREPMVESGLQCIRRLRQDGVAYFVANLGARGFDGWAPLGREPQGLLLMDPLTGASGAARLRQSASGLMEVRLQVPSGGSFLLIERSASKGEAAPWRYLGEETEVLPLDGKWDLRFVRGGPSLPDSVEGTRLGSWTELEDSETRRFAGTGRYSRIFELDTLPGDAEWVLDLGDVRDSARVYLNGDYAGTVWSLPSRLRVSDYLKQGVNTLSVEVTNTAANRIRDMDQRGVDWKIMREINFVDINYRPFDASRWAVEPSGLMGPVVLRAYSVE
ncbi:glycosyl hydrolase [Pelagicoccus sp. SDUM812003]|uniref:glycosyl hydrolase n=1 Tax=Pelagicoccus sp. SDUM812003 TaxID=3041267 RepID=UPI00280DCB4D|nr:glycosyl hydrolase [Pelagicoccus sp. SDUM812003]MDQ8202349.1 glycosyl hydrolase [Pelagicoccus sp. SDUM812003]